MTVQTTTSRADYTGNGVTTAFTVPFYFLDNTHVKVLRTQISTGVITTLALTTDYTMTGAGVSAGGTVTTLVAPTTDQKISILRNVPLTQLIHYVPNDPFPAATHEQALDQLTMEVQQLNENISRALTFSANTSGLSTTLPSPVANNLIGFNSTASGLSLFDPTTLLTIAASSGFALQVLSGTGSQTVYTLNSAPGAINNLEIFIGGVRQAPTTDYTLNGATLTFVAAPPSGTSNILCRWGQTLGIGIPSDSSVTSTKIVDGSVTTTKIADANVTAAKLASGAAASNIGYTPANNASVVHTTGAEAIAGGKSGTVVALTDAATITPDFSAGNNFAVTLAGNRTLANPTNIVAGQSGVIAVTQDATGSRTLAYGAYWKFASGTAPTLTTTASAVDLIAYYVDSATRINARWIGDVR